MFFRKLSINTKLMLLTASTASVALCLAAGAFVVNDVRTIRQLTIKQLSTLAVVLGENCTAAIEFDDPKSATETLASLYRQPMVENAYLFDGDDVLFAQYSRSVGAAAPPTAPATDGSRWLSNGQLEVARAIRRNNQLVGVIVLRATMKELHEQLVRYALIVLGVFVISLGAAVLLSSRLQRMISAPILVLAQAAERISERRDYSIRVQKEADDELGALYDQFNSMLDEIEHAEQELQQAHGNLEDRVKRRTWQLSQANEELSREIAERKRAEQELEALHHRLVETARRAGMADIATGVLHNVGNVLNGINVSANLVISQLRQSRVEQLARVVGLLEQHQDDLGNYLAQDAKGKQVPTFLKLLAEQLQNERADTIKELEYLTSKVDHVKVIVATQQNYAGVYGVSETFDITAALDDAVRLQAASFERHRIAVERDYKEVPAVCCDKQKVLQIFVNLVKNAKEAMKENGARERRLTFRARRHDDRVRVEVSDSGIGIAAENLAKIFTHGFTTKKDGHGFGLHSCAIAATELGGSLTARSDGPGRGATFVLELPCTSPVGAV